MSLAGQTALYGGSFNPPHLAHQMACLYLLEGLGATSVWLLPTYVHPFGKELAPFEDRLAMCRLLADPFGERVRVSDIERRDGTTGYTYDTVCALRQRHPERLWTLAIGADILAETHRWHRWDDLVALVPVVVLGRQGTAAPTETLALPQVSSRDIRRRLRDGDPIDGLVPERVRAYLEARGLYR